MQAQRLPPLNRDFFNHNPQIKQNERVPYPEYRYTKYFWLINLNQACYTREQAAYLVKLLRKAVLDVFTRGDVVAFAHPNHKWDRRYIGSNELQLAIEVGPKKGRVHAHLIQEVKHRSLINIDPADVKVRINQLLARWTGGRVTNAFVSRKIHPSSKPLEEYIDKDNTPWRNVPQVASGLFTYTLVYDGEQPVWDVYETTPRKVPELSTPANVTIPGKAYLGKPSGPSAKPGPSKLPRPTFNTPASASSGYDEEFLGAAGQKQRPLTPAERAVLKRTKRV